MTIQYLLHQQIDKTKWDKTIASAPNGRPYAYSWYLEVSCGGQWDALILGDYEAVMPMPWNRKLLGIRQIYQPLVSQQLGIFGKNITIEILKFFLKNIPKNFRLVHFKMNEANGDLEELKLGDNFLPPNYVFKKRTNLILSLQPSYEMLWKNYSKSLRKRLRKAKPLLRIEEIDDVAQLVNYYAENLENKVQIGEKAYIKIKAILNEIIKRNKGKIFAVYPPNEQIACTIGFFVFSHQRIINIFGASNPKGKEWYAMHFLLDYLIEKNAGKNWIFDFEGSDIEGIAAFFRSFGSLERPYYEVLRDNLPGWIKWVRKQRLAVRP